MALAIFDLDHTLLEGDSSSSWNEFVANEGLVDPHEHREANLAFNRDYHAGRLDVMAYEEFTMKVLPLFDMETLESLRARYIQTIIAPMFVPRRLAMLDPHREKGDFLLLLTATNRFIADPIAAMLGMDDILGSIPEKRNGRFTGKLEGTPCYGPGKVDHLAAWATQNGMDLKGSWFYSDSQNDIPLLERVDHPVTVTPDPVLAGVARDRGWRIITWDGSARP